MAACDAVVSYTVLQVTLMDHLGVLSNVTNGAQGYYTLVEGFVLKECADVHLASGHLIPIYQRPLQQALNRERQF